MRVERGRMGRRPRARAHAVRGLARRPEILPRSRGHRSSPRCDARPRETPGSPDRADESGRSSSGPTPRRQSRASSQAIVASEQTRLGEVLTTSYLLPEPCGARPIRTAPLLGGPRSGDAALPLAQRGSRHDIAVQAAPLPLFGEYRPLGRGSASSAQTRRLTTRSPGWSRGQGCRRASGRRRSSAR